MTDRPSGPRHRRARATVRVDNPTGGGRWGIPALIAAVGIIGVAAATGRWMPSATPSTGVAVTVGLSSLLLAAFTARRPPRPTWSSNAITPIPNTTILIYADVAIAVFLCSFPEPRMSLFGTNLLILVGIYSVFYTSRWLSVGHLAAVSAVIAVFGRQIFNSVGPDHDAASVLLRVVTCLVAVNGSVFLLLRLSRRMRVVLLQEQRDADTDPLTGVFNRRGFTRKVAGTVRGSDALLLLIDIDNFKEINDGYGHQAGDDVLATVARRLVRLCGPAAIVARLGGDEFAICVAGTHAPDILAEQVRAAAVSTTDRYPVTVSVGAGPLAFDVPYASPDEVIADAVHIADAALYSAKRRGGNAIDVVDP